jgi:hypothetical protein
VTEQAPDGIHIQEKVSPTGNNLAPSRILTCTDDHVSDMTAVRDVLFTNNAAVVGGARRF